jgi:hypothetical protein
MCPDWTTPQGSSFFVYPANASSNGCITAKVITPTATATKANRLPQSPRANCSLFPKIQLNKVIADRYHESGVGCNRIRRGLKYLFLAAVPRQNKDGLSVCVSSESPRREPGHLQKDTIGLRKRPCCQGRFLLGLACR